MRRSIGIPARLAVGFAQGEPNIQESFYTVRERDAHAWPGVYFPGYGWIEFEPTGNQDMRERRYAPHLQTPLILKSALERGGWQAPFWLNAGQPPHVTASERASTLQKLIPGAAPDIDSLLAEYQASLFSRRECNVQTARPAAWNILYKTLHARIKFFILG